MSHWLPLITSLPLTVSSADKTGGMKSTTPHNKTLKTAYEQSAVRKILNSSCSQIIGGFIRVLLGEDNKHYG